MPAASTAPGRALTVALVVIGCALSGCGRSNPYSLPEYDPKATGPAPAATGSSPARSDRSGQSDAVRVATPSPQVRFTPADALGQGAWAERGRIVARSAAQKAVVKAVLDYLTVRVQLSNTWQVDERALAASASGQAEAAAQEWALLQRQKDQRSIGRFVVNLSSVQVDGDNATVTGCHFDATSEVDQDGNVLIAPPGGVLITMHLRRTGSTWRVLDWPERPVPSCDWRK